MTQNPPDHVVPGSGREAVSGAVRVGDADPNEAVRVTVILRRAAPRSGAPAESAELALVERFAEDHGLSVTAVNPTARSVGLLGSVAQMNAAFGVNLGRYTGDGQTYRGREGDVHVPAELAGVVVAVLGLDDRPQARAHFRIAHDPRAASRAEGVAPRAATSGYPPGEVARRYGFPSGATGAGQAVAVIELGGGYRTADLTEYFAKQGVKRPTVSAVSVDGAKSTPGDDADAEVMLDIEVIGAVAPGAHIVVYFAPNTTSGFYDAIAAAVHDTRHKPSIISISWGEAEADWTTQAMDAYDELFADAGALGITVYAAAGDDGSRDNGTGDNVDFPASSPHVVGCGGTTLSESGEVVWNDSATGNGATGGGVSTHFGLPDYQGNAKVPRNPKETVGRGVPDVAGDADPLTGYQVRVNGRDAVIGGTSAVAPLWAGLTALANERNGTKTGEPHERLYAHPAAFVDITTGDNGGYHAGPGWDPCTGLGSPRGEQIVQILGG
ncbi:S53 family peptidase [Rugosimonospora acidiphila]|uniref:S53 family peptidase n=1 Tax=Rugosimonospora acidiphila TaxID=556531 RepID=A0ABP9RNG2_9ACTN